jgi:glycosyltransferase involved in cell wall biosynthesis
MLFALLRRKPLIVTHHGYQAICPNGLLLYLPTQQNCTGHFSAGHYWQCVKCNRAQNGPVRSAKLLLLTFIRRALSRFANSNVAVSKHVANRIALPASTTIPNGVPDYLGKQPAVGSTARIGFAYLGRLVAEKGVSVLIEAAGILKRRGFTFNVLILGEGSERMALQKQVASLELDNEVEFAGVRLGAQLEEAMKSVAAVVVPSIWEEPAPFSVIEQMMQSRLIIGSNIGGLPEQIGDSGFTFPAGDAHALAAHMQRIIEQPALITALGTKARQRALELFSLDLMISKYQNVLNVVRSV